MRTIRSYLFFLNFVLWSIVSQPVMAKLDQETYNNFLKEYQSKPGYLANHPEFFYKLSPTQLQEFKNSIHLTSFEFAHSVVIKGEQIPTLLGLKNSSLSIMSKRDGCLQPIPFQIDDMNKDGFFIYPNSLFNYQGKSGVIDATDEIVFMYRDTGSERCTPNDLPLEKGKIILEFEFAGRKGVRYAYLVKGSHLRAQGDYSNFCKETGIADNTFYRFKCDPNNVLDFKYVRCKVGSNSDLSIMDNITLELNTGIFNRWLNINLNNRQNIKGRIIAMNDGTVRATAIIQFRINYAKIPLMKVYTQYTLYDEGFYIPIKIHVPGSDILTNVLVDPKIDFYIDWNKMEGAKVAFSGSPKDSSYAIVDGDMSEFEKKSNIENYNNWLWMNTNRGWDTFATGFVPDNWKGKLGLFYNDNMETTNKYEKYPGAEPHMGFSVLKLDTESLDVEFRLSILFPISQHENPADFYKELRNPPKMSIHLSNQ